MTDKRNTLSLNAQLEAEIEARRQGTASAIDSESDLYGAMDAIDPDPGDTVGRAITVNQLRDEMVRAISEGITATEDIYDEDDVLLLASGSKITKRFLQLLRQRNIGKVRLRPPGDAPTATPQKAAAITPAPANPVSPVAPETTGATVDDEDLHTETTRMLDESLEKELSRAIPFHPVKPWRRPRLALNELKVRASRAADIHADTTETVADICSALERGHDLSSAPLRQFVTQYVSMTALDFDLLPLIVSMKKSGEDYLYDHCVDTSLVSMSIAAQLGLPPEQISDVGLAGMLQDIGMLRIPDEIRLAEREWTESERHIIEQHPIHTLSMLESMRKIPDSVKYVCYQTHERNDGSGYPRAISGDKLHTFAQIVSIADTYVALTNPRPHRVAMKPYDAAKVILIDASANRYNKAIVRVFLDAVSLFPIGSDVRLSDGTPARVLRANPGKHTRPVVEMLDSAGELTGVMADLLHEEDICVTSAL